MKQLSFILLVIAGLIAVPLAIAAAPSVPVTSVAALRAGNFGGAQTVALAGFYATSSAGSGTLIASPGDTTSADDSCTMYVDAAGHRFRRSLNGKPLNVAMCGARCGGVQVNDGHSTSGSAIITSVTARWTIAMVGWRAVVNKAAASGRQIDATVIAVTAPGSLTLASAAGATGSGEIVSVYPDDTAALDSAIANANKMKVALSLPVKSICGYANPGASVYKSISAPALQLNSGTLWLAHTGPTIDNGVGLAFTADGAALVGPGTISGLYQTDQGVPQFNTSAVLFSGTSGNSISGHVVIENTKGRAFLAGNVKDFVVSDLTVRDCGDFAYKHGPMAYDQLGRSMCGQVTQPEGSLTIKNYTGNNAAQAGLLVFGPTPRSFHASISNCSFSGNGYYGLDLEEIFGSLELSNCEQIGNGKPASGVLVYGGYQFRDVEKLVVSNVTSRLTDSNAFVLQSVDSRSNISDWSVNNLSVVGTAAHAGAIYLAFAWNGVPHRVALNNITYDNITIYGSSPNCNAEGPRQQFFSFSGLKASGLYQGPQTNFTPQGNPGQTLYVYGRDSDLGSVSIKPIGANQKSISLDFSGVRIDGREVNEPRLTRCS